jgi:hypothetical protein
VIETLRQNPFLAALAFACAALAAIVVLELSALGGGQGSSRPRKGTAPEAKLLPQVAAVSADVAYPETAARPLWTPTRRPAPAALATQQSLVRGQFVLHGVTIAGIMKIALLKEKSSGRIHRVEQGGEVNGVQVAEVEPSRVTLAQGTEREVLDLTVQKAGGATPGGPAAAVPPIVSTGGPFAPVGTPAGAAQAGRPAGQPPVATASPPPPGPQVSPGPLPAGRQPPSTTAGAANPSQGAVPQQPSAAPMTPEELLARRRARRNQNP